MHCQSNRDWDLAIPVEGKQYAVMDYDVFNLALQNKRKQLYCFYTE